MILNIFIIQFILVAAIDYLGFVDELNPIFRRITGSKIGSIGKPWSCSTCMSWWLSLLYIIITGNISFGNVALCMAAALSTPITLDLIHLIKDIATNIITCIYRFLGI